eukprot:8433-Heterococcus_DN1.PRE.3
MPIPFGKLQEASVTAARIACCAASTDVSKPNDLSNIATSLSIVCTRYTVHSTQRATVNSNRSIDKHTNMLCTQRFRGVYTAAAVCTGSSTRMHHYTYIRCSSNTQMLLLPVLATIGNG